MNTIKLDTATVVVPAADASGNPGIAKNQLSGNMLFIARATAPFQMRFDAMEKFVAEDGFKFTDPNGPFTSTTYYNYLTVPITITIYVGSAGVDYVGPNVVKPAATQPQGNLGFNSAQAITNFYGAMVHTATVANAGNGLSQVGDLLTVAGGTGRPAVLMVTAIHGVGGDTKGTVKSVSIQDPGNYTANPATPNHVTGGSGSGVQINLTFVASTGAGLSWAAGYLTLSQTGPLKISNPATNARKSITFKVKAGSAAGLLIMDANGNTLRDLLAGEEETYESSGTFTIIADANATCTFTIAELYYT